MKALLCFDGSPFSERVLLFSAKLLRKKDEVTLLYVRRSEAPSGYLKERIEEEIKALEEIVHKEWKEPSEEILERGRRLLKKEGITAKIKHREGDPSREILEESRAGYDVIVLGSRGAGGLSLLLGHTCKSVMDNAKIPVITIKLSM